MDYISELKNIGAPELIIGINDGSISPATVDYLMERPEMFFSLKNQYSDAMPYQDSLLPLWEVNGEMIVAYVKGRNEVIEYWYEDSTSKFKVIGKTPEDGLIWLYAYQYYDLIEDYREELLPLINKLGFDNDERFWARVYCLEGVVCI